MSNCRNGYMKNNYEKLRTLCHQNCIGSDKCGECKGKKYINFEKVKEVNGIMELTEKGTKDCPTCQGKGYTIPLEFGCELEILDKKCFFISKPTPEVTIVLEDGYKCNYNNIAEIKNLGKPLTLQDVLRLLSRQKTVRILGAGEEYYKGEKPVNENEILIWHENGRTIFLELTKDPKDWSDETIQAIIDIVK